MNNWRLLLLAFLAAIQPIASFTESNLVDGLQECCNHPPHTLLRDSRQLYGTHRFSKITPEEYRLDQREELRENRRYEVREPSLTRHSSDRLLLDSRERNNRHLSRYSRAENSFGRNTQNRDSFSTSTSNRNARDTDDIHLRISRELETGRENRLEAARLFQDERRTTRLEYEQYSSNFRRETRNPRDARRISYRNDIQRDMNDEDMARERHTQRRQSLIRSELSPEMDNNRERRSLDRRVREGNDVSRRSLSLEARISRVTNIREDSRAHIREDILEDHEHIDFRTNKRSLVTRQQRDVSRVQKDRTISVRSAEHERNRKEVRNAALTSDRRSSFEQRRIRESSDSSRLADIRDNRNAYKSRSADNENFRLDRNTRISSQIGNDRLARNRHEIRDTEIRSTTVGLDENEIFSINRLEIRSHERLSRSQQNTRSNERRFAAVTRKQNEQFSKNRQEVMDEENRGRQNNARVVRNQLEIRSIRRSPTVSRDENERVSKLRLETRADERRFWVARDEIADRFTKTREYIRHDERLSSTVRRVLNEQLSKNRQDNRYRETFSRQFIPRFTVNREDIRNNENRLLVTREENIRSSRNQPMANGERRSIEQSRENSGRSEIRNTERLSPSATREETERLSQYRLTTRNHDRESVVVSQQELFRNRQVERFSRESNRMESERFSRNHREVRSDERRSQVQQHRRENIGRAITREDIRYNEIYSRLASRDGRNVRRDTLRTKEEDATRSHDSIVDRTRSGNRPNSRENVLSRSAKTLDGDVSKTRIPMRREIVGSQLRNSRVAKNREAPNVKNLTKMYFEKPIIDMNWQMVLYTLQGIYLCSFLMQMVTDNAKNTTKSRSFIWLALPFQNLKLY